MAIIRRTAMATTTRKLAAIMPAYSNGQSPAGRFTDIVGYTALMGFDKDG